MKKRIDVGAFQWEKVCLEVLQRSHEAVGVRTLTHRLTWTRTPVTKTHTDSFRRSQEEKTMR